MNPSFPVRVALLSALSTSVLVQTASARRGGGELATPLELTSPLPARAPSEGARADTARFGYYQMIGGTAYAVAGEKWTFDHGAPDPFEGWTPYEHELPPGDGFRRINAAAWAGHGNLVAPPIPAGQACAWVGRFEDEADAACWNAGLGYGNNAAFRYESRELTYTGTGDVTLSFRYFNNTKLNEDFVRVVLLRADGTEQSLNGDGFSDAIGAPEIGFYPTFSTTLHNADFASVPKFKIAFELATDDFYSDQDGNFPTEYGPFAVDNIALSGNLAEGNQSWNFESGDHGFQARGGEGFARFAALHPREDYQSVDGCGCNLEGNVLTFHDASGHHPSGQRDILMSPVVDLRGLAPSNQFIAAFDFLGELPHDDGVMYSVGWVYYPYTCGVTGQTQWSPVTGEAFHYTGPLICGNFPSVAPSQVPADADFVRLICEVFSSCDAFSIPPSVCTGNSNRTPIFDNFQVLVTPTPVPLNAPTITVDSWSKFIDGFGQGAALSPSNPGNADTAFDLHGGGANPARLGDSLLVKGPTPTASTKWEARMWWRIPREGPSQSSISAYETWKTAVADGRNIAGPSAEFTFAYMDSLQAPGVISKNTFISEFRENDDDFAGENSDANEMIRDGILTPGTRVQYFLTANYVASPSVSYFLPDTTGGNFYDFEILPSYRLVDGVPVFPSLLLIDPDDWNPVESVVSRQLNVALNGAGPNDPLPDPPNWDRYDYVGASVNGIAALARLTGGNNGVPLSQLLGYRGIVVPLGNRVGSVMKPLDYTLLGDWLSSSTQNGNVNRQGLLFSGSSAGSIVSAVSPTFLSNYLGASLICGDYSDPACGPSPADHRSCVAIDAAPNAAFAPALDYDAWGNWCPQVFKFDVLGVSGGTGNRVYRVADSDPPVVTAFSQVVSSVTGEGSSNYRSVLDGVSWHQITPRADNCSKASASIIEAGSSELKAALCWIFDGAIPGFSPCVTTGVGDSQPLVTVLEGNRPNPFNPQTTIRFTLAKAGPAELSIYDVQGRRVRALVDASLDAGPHDVTWDGTSDAGAKLGSGVYWMQLRAGTFVSNRKMIALAGAEK